MKTVIVVNGYPRAGKDTAVDFMRAWLLNGRVSNTAYSAIDVVRVMLGSRDIDLSAKTPADRKLLATVGDAMQEHSQFITNMAFSAIKWFFHAIPTGVFFLHMREPDRIEIMRQHCEAIGVRLIKVCVISDLAEKVFSNTADANVDQIEYDWIIDNNASVEELDLKCKEFLALNTRAR